MLRVVPLLRPTCRIRSAGRDRPRAAKQSTRICSLRGCDFLFHLLTRSSEYRAMQVQEKTPRGAYFYGLIADLTVGILFSTRLPLVHSMPIGADDVARASWSFPVTGALVGAIGALVYGVACWIGVPALPAAALALAATAAATGCLHEDGLADTVDGFGGGKDREQKLAIMRDSR